MFSRFRELLGSDLRGSIPDQCFQILRALRTAGVPAANEYERMTSWAVRLSHTTYRSLSRDLLRMKVTLHLSGYCMTLFGRSPIGGSLSRHSLSSGKYIRIILVWLLGRNPRGIGNRGQKKTDKSTAQELRRKNFEANLALNVALSKSPEDTPPDYIPKDLPQVSMEILNISMPSIDDRRKVTAYESYMTRLQLYRGSATRKPGVPSREEYDRIKSIVFRYHKFRDTVLRTLTRVCELRRFKTYSLEYEIEQIEFIELYLRYQRQAWYLSTHDFREDPHYVQIVKREPDPIPIPLSVDNPQADPPWATVVAHPDSWMCIATYLLCGVKLPDNVLEFRRVRSLSVPDPPMRFVNRGSIAFFHAMEVLKEAFGNSFMESEAGAPTSNEDLSDALSGLEFSQNTRRDWISSSVFSELRRILHLPFTEDDMIGPSCACSCMEVLSSEHRHSGLSGIRWYGYQPKAESLD